eukprot:7388708-Prymnesium_polylepis.1
MPPRWRRAPMRSRIAAAGPGSRAAATARPSPPNGPIVPRAPESSHSALVCLGGGGGGTHATCEGTTATSVASLLRTHCFTAPHFVALPCRNRRFTAPHLSLHRAARIASPRRTSAGDDAAV